MVDTGCYAIHWMPCGDNQLGQFGYNWFHQKDYFQETLDILKPRLFSNDFAPAFTGFNENSFYCELIPPFYLQDTLGERDLVVYYQDFFMKHAHRFDVHVDLENTKTTLVLSSAHKISMIKQLRSEALEYFKDLIKIQPISDTESCDKFQITLARSDNEKHIQDLYLIAQYYWQDAMRKAWPIDYVYLCFQKNHKSHFRPIMKFSL